MVLCSRFAFPIIKRTVYLISKISDMYETTLYRLDRDTYQFLPLKQFDACVGINKERDVKPASLFHYLVAVF